MVPFSKSTQSMRSSEIREILKLAVRPDVISFAGGMPNNDLFPIEELDEIYSHLPTKLKKIGMQYGPTAGYPPLIGSLKKYLGAKGLTLEDNDLIVTTGSMQAIYLLAKVFIDPGDRIITEYPCFIGATAAFNSFQPELESVPIDDDGIIISQLEKAFSRPAKFLYLTPNFHNPAGIIYSTERKKQVLQLLQNKEIVLIEDDPYNELYFEKKDEKLTTPIKTMGDPVPICYTGSFSKIFGPGMRLGWLLAPKKIIAKCELAKQAVDACSPTFTQVLANEFMRKDIMPKYLQKLRASYARRLDVMLQSLKEYMPSEVEWTHPRGGFYVWLTFPERVDATDVLKESIDNRAVFVIGKAFDPESRRNNCLRLSFSYPAEDKIQEGIKIVADAIKYFL
ncbi:MAG: aminotransferase class I/II-fold pyridoxal phosphate-dependent enzyme [Actinobacteria bacterium]|nr:aminotransferase class I/II-fold pyridoxal phosphate-dependent enzyme [Actinomycetota bacterium]